MTRYSGASGLVYGTYGTGVYGTGDIPDLRLSGFAVSATDGAGSYVDAVGQPVFGRGTVSWGFRANITPKVKLLRSTKGFATSHQDNFSTVVAATDYPIKLAAATVIENGWTVIATTEPHYLKSGDVVTFSGVPVPTKDSSNVSLPVMDDYFSDIWSDIWPGGASPLIDGSWVVSIILSPTTFGLRQNHKPLAVGTTAMLVSASGLTGLPFDVSGFSTYTPVCGSIATPSMSRLASDQVWVTDSSVVPGVEYYYSLWVGDPTVPGLWVFGGEAAFLAPSDHDSIARFFDALPPYLTNVNYGSSVQPLIDVLSDTDALTPGTPTVGKFLAGLAWGWDDILTHVDKVQRLWDVSSMPAALLPSAIATFGLPDEPTFGMRSRRALVQDAQYLSASRGTGKGLEAFVEALVGLPAACTVGQNLMLNTDCSSFAYSTGSWAVSNAAVSRVATPTLTVPATTYFVTNTATTLTGVLDAPKSMAATTASTGNVVASLAGGVPNTLLTATTAYISVQTASTHGLDVGDKVTISEATAYNVSGIVTAVQSTTQYTLVPSSGSLTAGTGTGGRTGYNSASLTNPFAITQGIPVSAGTGYKVSFSAAASTGSKSVAAGVSWWDVQGHYLSTASILTATATGTTLTQQTPGAVTAPTLAAYLTLDLTFASGITGTIFYLDGVMVTPSTGTSTFEDARTVTVSMTASPASIAADTSNTLQKVVKARLVDNMQNQLPVGVAFRLSINAVAL